MQILWAAQVCIKKEVKLKCIVKIYKQYRASQGNTLINRSMCSLEEQHSRLQSICMSHSILSTFCTTNYALLQANPMQFPEIHSISYMSCTFQSSFKFSHCDFLIILIHLQTRLSQHLFQVQFSVTINFSIFHCLDDQLRFIQLKFNILDNLQKIDNDFSLNLKCIKISFKYTNIGVNI